MKHLRQRKVLIIDEINYTRLGIDYALTNYGYRVTSVRSGEEAMQHITIELPDVVILSLRYNDTNGMDILKNMKEYFRLRLDIAQGAEPPIIVMIASKDSKQAREIQYLGASVTLFKPINIQELPNLISSTIAKGHKPAHQERKKILIFDGEIRSHKFVESVLADESYDFETSESEGETMAKIRNRKFDMAILDISSFEDDALVSLGKIREIAPEMPIITVTAFGGRISAEDFANLKIQKHFTKPINVIELQIIVDELIAGNAKEANTGNKGEIDGNESSVDNLIDGITNQMENKESLV
jgi:DNA-binding NtrC family response regulator